MNKRGISPLIATVLLITFTIVISVVITAWIRTGLETQLASGSEKIGSATACLSTKVDIPPAANKGVCAATTATDNKNIKILVDNKGDSTIIAATIRIIYDTEAKTIRVTGTTGDGDITNAGFPLATLNRVIIDTTLLTTKAATATAPATTALSLQSNTIKSVEVIPIITEGTCKEGSMDIFTESISSPIKDC